MVVVAYIGRRGMGVEKLSCMVMVVVVPPDTPRLFSQNASHLPITSHACTAMALLIGNKSLHTESTEVLENSEPHYMRTRTQVIRATVSNQEKIHQTTPIWLSYPRAIPV